MRKGFNPNKNILIKKNEVRHQVIIPVYIPHHSDYFKDSFTILKYCLESLIITSNNQLFISIVDNGSSENVKVYLQKLFVKNQIQELIHTTNIGKFNAIIKGLAGHQFDLITIADADVLFLNDWLEKTYEIFTNFSNAGVVSTTPNSKLFKYLTGNIMSKYLLSNKLRFTNVEDVDAMRMFARSIDNNNLFNKYHLNKYLTLEQEKCKAVVGCGHFVATYKSEILSSLLNERVKFKLGKEIRKILDLPAYKLNYFRLSTVGNFTYHLGNTMEDWMPNKLEEIKRNQVDKKLKHNITFNIEKTKVKFNLHFYVAFDYLFKIPFVLRAFLRFKGLTKKESNNY